MAKLGHTFSSLKLQHRMSECGSNSCVRRWGRRRTPIEYAQDPLQSDPAEAAHQSAAVRSEADIVSSPPPVLREEVAPLGTLIAERRRLLAPPKQRRPPPLATATPASVGCRGSGYRGQSEMELATGASRASGWHQDASQWPALVGGEASDDLAAFSPLELSRFVGQLERDLGHRSVSKARRDQHAKRQPIACGVQIISGHGCSYACRYCYIQDWYPFTQPTPSDMSGQEVLLSLMYNEHWIPSRDFIILGDVCDPFHPNLEVRTMEYIRSVAPLGSPIQFSTKSAVNAATCEQLARWSTTYQCPINALVTITTMKHVADVEPDAPSVQTRLETIFALSSAGLSVFLFLRPLLPGSCEDFAQVLGAARDCGAEGVVVGSLRVSRKIYRRLKQSSSVDIKAVDEQLRQKGIEPTSLTEQQVDIQDEPLRAAVTAQADALGLTAVRRACCANALGAQMPCRKAKCLMRSVIAW